MDIENAKNYLKKLENNIKSEGEEKVSCSALVYILNQFLEELGKDLK